MRKFCRLRHKFCIQYTFYAKKSSIKSERNKKSGHFYARFHPARSRLYTVFCCLASFAKNACTRKKINIHPPSGWFFTCGQSPLFLATRPTRNTICHLRGDCYLLPLKGLSAIVNCSPISSSLSWFFMYSAIRLVFFPAVST